MSYSSFAYSHLRLSPIEVKAGDPLTVEVDVRNASAVAGDEVAELYIAKDDSPPAQHPRALKGFERIHLGPGETRHVTFTVSPRDLSLVSDAGEHEVFPGGYEVFVGGAQKAEAPNGLWTQFVIAGDVKLPR
jgi:beta-glucosidase